MPIVRSHGFVEDDWSRASGAARRIAPLDALATLPDIRAVDAPADADADALAPHFDRLDLVAVAFESFADGRGFSLAARLRDLGFGGRLRATGAVLPDQFAMALACGFDEVEIDADRAARQPAEQWVAAAARPAGSYQARVAAA